MKTLFITNETDRTGAPIMLLEFLKWISKNKPTISFDCYSLKSGALDEHFRMLSKRLFIRSKANHSLLFRIFLSVKRRISIRSKPSLLNRELKIMTNEKYDLIYANTTVSLKEAVLIKRNSVNKPKLILHVHELELMIKETCPDFESYLSDIDQIIAASELVKKQLIDFRKVSPDLIKVVYEIGDSSDFGDAVKHRNKNFTVGGSGKVGVRKGTDLFIQIARIFFSSYPDTNVKFTWVGKMDPVDEIYIKEDLRLLALQEKVFFLGESKDPKEEFNKFDLFLMTSRLDPFPLVCIETGQLGIPILCFQGVTGTEEVLARGGGSVLPFMDLEGMAKRIFDLSNDHEQRKSLSLEAKHLFDNFKPDVIAPKLMEIIEKNVNS